MGAVKKIDIYGAKGGSDKPKTPTEAPDSLRSIALAKMLIAVGEGEFEGMPTDSDIRVDGTPLRDPQGNMNFPNVKWEWRTGSVDQPYIQGIPSIENEITIGVELRSTTPWVRAITNTQLSAVRVRLAWPALQSVDASGNINGYRIEYKVELATDGGAYQQVLSEAVDGKTTTVYERTRRIDLPRASTGWLMRVTRTTINQNNNKISDTMQIAGFTEVIDAKIRYPNTALLYIEFSAEQFRSIPAITIRCKGRKWQVPSNYDSASRSYSGIWDGTFKEAWTDNPVWHTYGITTNDRFGLGRRIKQWMVDKWELYRISQYCDQMVPDGKGGQEPRFICNLNLQSKADAWSLLRDISAIYRGMTYWAQGQVFTLADMPRATDFDFAYTRANVIDGKFTYSSASERTRYTRALISYDNPLNNYDTDVTAVTDAKLQRRYGDNPLEISAIGCTRESEAQRRGKWALLTNSKDRAVTFKVGLDGRIPLPGYVIPIADELLAGRPVGGRISAVNGKVITLDRDTQAKPGDRLILNLPDGKCEGRTVQVVSGRQVTVTMAYSVAPERELVWALDADDLSIPLYRVVSVARPEPGVFEISAVQYDPSKFAHIDTGARLEERPISVIPITVVPAPVSVTITSNYSVDQGLAISTMNISWPAVNGAVAYDVEWRKDSGNWIKLQRTGATSVDVTGIYSGAYLARVRSVSAFEISSIWKSSNLTNLEGKVGLPPAVAFLRTTSELFGIGIKWGFPPGAEDTQRTELWYGPANDLSVATKLADLAHPQADYRMQSLLAGATLFFWARLVDRTGNVGPFFPVGNGVMGQASADAAPVLELITGEILESHLGQELTDRIDLIDKDGPGSVNDRLAEVRTDLNGQIAEVDGALADAKAELQQQIDTIADLADSMPYKPGSAYSAGQGVLGKDGVIYQAKQAVPVNTPPPNATYWTDVGQAVQAANALAVRVSTAETKITNIEGVNTSQASQITGLQTSLTTTNGNVTAAQNAANAANTLAGGKGKVLVQSATPATADQLAQNLWIDTTGNANTPKRWTGSAWAAVTDKAATDAATAAANALALAQTKADASAVNSLTTRVSSAEGTISSQGSAITGLNNSLTTTNQNVTAAQNAANAANTLAGGKGKVLVQSAAPAAADQLAQNLWIDTTNNANTPKRWTGSAWAAVTDKVATDAAAAAASALTQVATKADASTVQSLGNTVSQQGQQITAAGQAITNISASLTQVGGENLLYNPSLDVVSAGSSSLPDGWILGNTGVTLAASIVASTLDPSGKALRLGVTVPNASSYVDLVQDTPKWPGVSEGQVLTVSGNFRATDGLIAQLFFQWRDASGANISTDGARSQNASIAPEAWQRFSRTSAPAPGGTVSVRIIFRIRGPLSGASSTGWCEWDRLQLELGAVMTGWRDNGRVNAAGITTNAIATTALTGRVGATEAGLTSASGQLTELNNTIGDAGGENLFFNSTFSKSASTSGAADGWEVEGPAPSTDTLIASWLSSGEKAQRIVATGLTSTSTYRSLRTIGAKRVNVAANQTVTASAYVRRGGDPVSMRIFVVWLNAQDATLSSPASAALPLTVEGSRIQFSAVAPANAVKAQIYFRAYGPGTSGTPGVVEIARPQAEYAPRATGWRDNGQVNADAAAAASAAVDGLSSTVSQQGANLASVAARTITLENSVNSSTNGLATKASASAVDALTNRVTAAEGVNTSQSGSITELNNSLGSLQGAIGASGLDPAQDALWQFDTGTDGWTVAGATISGANGAMTITANSTDPRIVSPGTLAVVGAQYPLIRARITRRAGPLSDWDGRIYYSTSGHGQTASYYKAIANPNLAVGQSTVVEWDMAALTAGGADWVNSTITNIRMDFGNVSGGVFEVDWIAIGRMGPSASSRAVSSLDSKVTQQGSDLSAQAQQITGLQTSVGNNTASVQQVATAQSALDEKVGASYSVKLQVASGGRYVAAGFGVGVENNGGVLQSTFAVMANRFAVLNPSGSGFVSPFAIQNGQVFINSAFIQDGTITNAKIGNYIASNNYVAGVSGWKLFFDGTFEINSAFGGQARQVINSAGGKVFDENGIKRYQWGDLSA